MTSWRSAVQVSYIPYHLIFFGDRISELLRSSALILAAAAVELFPGVCLIQGESTKLSFYYDFIFPFTFQDHFLSLLEEKMRQIIKEKRPIKCLEMVPCSAAAFLEHHGQAIRAEAARNETSELVDIFQMGEFIDLSSSPYLSNSSELEAFKLQESMTFEQEEGVKITRISGTAFEDKKKLKEFLKHFENAAQNDAVKWGEQLDFITSDVAVGERIWRLHPKGEKVRQLLYNFLQKEREKQQFQTISTPRPKEVDEKGMWNPITEAHIRFFQSRYKDASVGPVRLQEVAYVWRENEKEKVEPFAAMLQPQACFVDLSHIFCSSELVLKECSSCLQFIAKIPKILGFEFEIVLSTEPKTREAISLWKKAERWLKEALESIDSHLVHVSDQVSDGNVKNVNGPRVEVRIGDQLGRSWTTSFLELDCLHPHRLKWEAPLITCSAYGPFERLFGLLLEQHQGVLPFGLMPEQVRVLLVGKEARAEALSLMQVLASKGVRANLDERLEPVGKRIHQALREKVPYAIVFGEREQRSGALTIRRHDLPQEQKMRLEEFIQEIKIRRETFDFEN